MTVPQRIAPTMPAVEGIKETIELAQWAEKEGFDDVWFADVPGNDSLTTAAGVAMATDRVRIGTAIVPVFTRTPAVFAATAKVLHELSGGRFILGIGSSSQFMMVNMNGQVFEKPLSRVRETTQLVKQMLQGEKSNFSGDTVSSHGYRQPGLAPGAQPVYVAALRSKMLEMAAEVADGVILNLFPFEALPKMMEHIRIGAERGGKRLEDIEVVCRHQVVVTNDADRARDQLRAHFAPYYATPVYNKFLSWAGYPDTAAKIAEGWANKDRNATTGAISDDMLDAVTMVGDKAYCQDRIRQYAAAGITTHIISCVSRSENESTDTIEAFKASNFSF